MKGRYDIKRSKVKVTKLHNAETENVTQSSHIGRSIISMKYMDRVS